MKNRNIKWWIIVAFVIMAAGAKAQTTVKGVVFDETNAPMAGASVRVKGAPTGVVTDMNGTFALPNLTPGMVIEASYMGYETQEVRYDSQRTIHITLKPIATVVDEVVVVGYGTVKRGDLTGSVASVAAKDVENYKSGSVVEALGGQIAGVSITQNDGTPGAGFSVNIRGVGTLTGDASPLYVVDGFQVEDIGYLANSDIASIEILKDASASAIYGSRAANGVVLVTTKSGKIGRPVVSYSGSASYRRIAKRLDLLNPYEFVRLQAEINSSYEGTYYKTGDDSDGIPYKYQSLEDYIGVNGVDWQKETFKPTWSQDHNISVAGGNDNTQYTFSFSHYDEDGIFTNSGFKKTTGKMRFTHRVTKDVKVDATVNYVDSKRNGVGTSADAGRFNMLAQIVSARPTGGLKIDDETLLKLAIDPVMLDDGSSLAQVNPIRQAQAVTQKKNAEMWSANAAVTWQVIKGLTFKSSGTYSTTNTRNDVFYGQNSKEAYRNGQKPYGQTQMVKARRYANTNQLTWQQTIDKKHKYDVMIAQEINFNSTEYLTGQSMDFPFDNLGNHNLGIGSTPSKVETNFSDKTLLSFFARGNYNYDNRYLVTATIRADGSSVFAKNHRWGYFPSFSFAWRVSQEAFMKKVPVISDLKVRLGWGTVGNDRISSNLSLDLYQQLKYGVGQTTVTVLQPKQIRNQNLKWEGSTTTNLGIDLSMFKNRLNVTADFFLKDTKDLLLAQSLVHVTGFDSQYQNIGKIRNKGIELTVNARPVRKRDFELSVDANISFIRNELRALQSGVRAMYSRTGFDGNVTDYDYISMVGKSLGLIYGYKFDGVYQSSDFWTMPDGSMKLKDGITNNKRYGTVVPGAVKYKDVDGDKVITTGDRTVIGRTIPKFYGGFGSSMNYKNLDFGFTFQYSYGNDVFNAMRLYATQSKLGRRNMMAEVADRWTPTNASNKVPAYNGYITNDINSRFVEDGSFLRLKSVTLGYTLPKVWLDRIHVSKMRVYMSAQNLLCITGYSGYDPEVNMASANPMTPGLDWGAYPKSRVFIFGVDIQF